MIAGSVANNVGFSLRQLHLIPVEKCADCRFVVLRLQVATGMCIVDVAEIAAMCTLPQIILVC